MEEGIEELEMGVHCVALLPFRLEHGALQMV